MKDLILEGRNIQETFKKNVLNEETIKSKFNPNLSVKVGDDSVTLITPYGNITFEVAGQYDDFSTEEGVGMSLTNPKGGITQSEWRKAADAIHDFVSNEDDYLEASKKLLDPKVLGKYIPKIVGKSMSSGIKAPSTTPKKLAVATPSTKSWEDQDADKILKKIPSRLRYDAEFQYVGKILKRIKPDMYYPVVEIMDDAYIVFNRNQEKTLKYLQSLYVKPGRKDIYTNFNGKEELELKFYDMVD